VWLNIKEVHTQVPMTAKSEKERNLFGHFINISGKIVLDFRNKCSWWWCLILLYNPETRHQTPTEKSVIMDSKNVCMSKLLVITMCIFFHIKGKTSVRHSILVPWERRRNLWPGKWIFHHDNVPSHTAVIFSHSQNWKISLKGYRFHFKSTEDRKMWQ
jgi:hypothetical protein